MRARRGVIVYLLDVLRRDLAGSGIRAAMVGFNGNAYALEALPRGDSAQHAC
jgi:hypothetical protein